MTTHCSEMKFVKETQTGRRQFLRAGIFGGAAALLAPALWPLGTFAAGHTDVLLLSCMDYRLVGHTRDYMVKEGLGDEKYDYIVLAGASLGAVTKKFPAWNTTFWDHLGLAIDLHHIHKVMILDHRDCGAYEKIFGIDFYKFPAKETRIHTVQLQELRRQIKQRYGKRLLDVELLLMDLKGKVEKI
jgi:hypothetical protein